MSTVLHYVRCKDALLDCSAPGGERCESLTWVDEIAGTEAEYQSNDESTNDTPYLALTGELWRIFWEYL